MKERECLAIFGGGELQLSLLERSMEMGIDCVVLDPNPDAAAKKISPHFEVISGSDYDGTKKVVEKYRVKGLITSSTDKPLVMMARIAHEYSLPFISEETAINATDKSKMKEVFFRYDIPCAKGFLINGVDEIKKYPTILKPVDNSGSRGVFYCNNQEDAINALPESKNQSSTSRVLCEEYISGKEYSIESIHFNGQHTILQITEKILSTPPYQVEMGHIAPALLPEKITSEISKFIEKIGEAFDFKYCAAHTELKINEKGIFIIETSPRLGGDYITSKLFPISTGADIQDLLISICLGKDAEIEIENKTFAGIFYLCLEAGIINQIDNLQNIQDIEGVIELRFDLKKGDRVNQITNSLDRYGYLILKHRTKEGLLELKERIFTMIKQQIKVQNA